MTRIVSSVLLGLMFSASLSGMAAADQPKKGPVQVFILAGQSNMEGQAVADLDGKIFAF